MNQQVLINKKVIIAIVILIVVLVGITIATVVLSRREVQTLKNNPSLRNQPQVEIPPKPILKTLDNKIIPTLPASQGGGIDIDSKVASDSAAEIAKLQTYLPYLKTYKLSPNLEVDALINEQALQDNPWSLMVDIYGIDYELPLGSEEDNFMKNSFREVVSNIFTWMQGNGINPRKIIFTWGDREFIQTRVEQWLK